MKRLCGPVLALFTFILGVAISPIRFYGEMSRWGPKSSIKLYRSSYFVRVASSHVTYDSTAEASDSFNQELREAVRVVEITQKVNKHGVIVGQRAVTVVFLPEFNQYQTRVFWTEGRILFGICSSSFLHVMEFEKRNPDKH